MKHFEAWTVLSVLGVANSDKNGADFNVFTIKDTKLNVAVITLLAKDNQKLSKRLSKEFERLTYWHECKATSENKNMVDEYRYLL